MLRCKISREFTTEGTFEFRSNIHITAAHRIHAKLGQCQRELRCTSGWKIHIRNVWKRFAHLRVKNANLHAKESDTVENLP